MTYMIYNQHYNRTAYWKQKEIFGIYSYLS